MLITREMRAQRTHVIYAACTLCQYFSQDLIKRRVNTSSQDTAGQNSISLSEQIQTRKQVHSHTRILLDVVIDAMCSALVPV